MMGNESPSLEKFHSHYSNRSNGKLERKIRAVQERLAELSAGATTTSPKKSIKWIEGRSNGQAENEQETSDQMDDEMSLMWDIPNIEIDLPPFNEPPTSLSVTAVSKPLKQSRKGLIGKKNSQNDIPKSNGTVTKKKKKRQNQKIKQFHQKLHMMSSKNDSDVEDRPRSKSTISVQSDGNFGPQLQLVKRWLFYNEGGPIWQEIALPDYYHPDLADSERNVNLIVNGKTEVFHRIGRSSSQAKVLAAQMRHGESLRAVRVAAKRYNLEEMEKKCPDDPGYRYLCEELRLANFSHNNIIQVLDVFSDLDSKDDLSNIWITTERMDCSLDIYFDELKRNDLTNNPTVREHWKLLSLLTQILRALDYLDQKRIIHRDLTPKNVAINKQTNEIKLLDFGIARRIDSRGQHTEALQTPWIYRPLECLLRKKYDSGMDIWATGLVALEMIGVKLMFPVTQYNDDDDTETQVVKRILEVMGVPENYYREIFGEELVTRGAQIKENRLKEELERPLGRLDEDKGNMTRFNLTDLVLKMLSVNPQLRPRPYECLQHPYLMMPESSRRFTKKNQEKQLLRRMLARISSRFAGCVQRQF